MSVVTFKSLPLEEPHEAVISDEGLLFAWESINVWVQMIIKCTEATPAKKYLKSHAGFILLACKYVPLRLGMLAQEQPDLPRAELVMISTAVRSAALELRNHDVVKEIFGYDTDLERKAVKTGSQVCQSLMAQKKTLMNKEIPAANLLAVKRIWKLISLYSEREDISKIVTRKFIKDNVRWLEKQLAAPSSEGLFSHKRQHEGDGTESSRREKRAKPDQDIAAQLAVWRPEDLAKIKRYIPEYGVVPCEGRTKSPVAVQASDMSTLRESAWLNDVIIDAYMALVSHHVNSHFDENSQRTRSPTWQVWSIWTVRRLQGSGNMPDLLRRSWPPQDYPDAALEDVKIHLFPVPNIAGNHWMLIILAKDQGGRWEAHFFSSLPGYDRDFEAAWVSISGFLLSASHEKLDVKGVSGKRLEPEPRQANGADCGVFVLGVARWLREGWDLQSLTQDKIPNLRHRIMLELENWSLDDDCLD